MSRGGFRGWFVDLAVGGLGGLVIAWIVAVNLVIYLGVEGGIRLGLVMFSGTVWCLASS